MDDNEKLTKFKDSRKELNTVTNLFFDLMKEQIQTGVLKTEKKLLSERKLAEKYNLSRNTVRGGLSKLEAYGFVVKTRKGTFITEQNMDNLLSSYNINFEQDKNMMFSMSEFRKTVEVSFAEIILKNITASHIKELRKINENIKNQLTVRGIAQQDYLFHSTLLGLANNLFLDKIFLVFKTQLLTIWELGRDYKNDILITYNGHKMIIDAYEEGNLKKIKKICTEHSQKTINNLACLTSDDKQDKDIINETKSTNNN